MPDFDAALKLLLRRESRRAIQLLAGLFNPRWLDIELPKAQNLRMDLLAEDARGDLHHFELQSTNDPRIDLRMAEYALGTYRLMGKFPRQLVLYVGEAPLDMPSELRGPRVRVGYDVVNIRELDGEALLASNDVGDNVIAILTNLRDHREAVRRIVAKIGTLPEGERNVATQQLVILAGLRRLEPMVQEEVQKMPIIIDLMENQIIGPAIRKGLEQGLQEGRQKGRQEGRQEGEQRFLRLLMEKRFGPLPSWAAAKLSTLSIGEIEALGERIFDATTLEDLLPAQT